ncbi:RBP11-like subunits of RNA polymerase [Massarina eburnea CBS 473.64]|uniref:DNA-directed RNA polymerases I and III subunit RPAC2 n=1 Tax=Massarina eburnea CBS 473.64 TaxID=1395130 RepID=A0A6A6RX96_9PLEO|nr:RBP11-like subunits of RNA polymerase [Massarina eburnea CBS 473.64]
MPEQVEDEVIVDRGEIDEVADRDRIRVLAGATETAASFQFDGEDHTLGNALRYVIMKNPDVEFCGYSIPHPSENKMNLRIQTYDGVNVYTVLEKGLNDLMDICDVVEEKFTVARDEHFADKMQT